MARRQGEQTGGTLGGGTGAGGDGNEDEALSEGSRKEVEAIVNQAVNGAITNQLTRFKKTFSEEIGKQLGEALGPISEQLKTVSERNAAAAAAGTPPPGGQAGAAGGVAAATAGATQEWQATIARLEGRSKELETQLQQERKAREDEKAGRERERQESLAKEERAELAAALRTKGITEPQVRAAVALLAGEDKLLGRAEDGSIIFKVQKGTGQGRYVDEVTVDVGVEEWLKTDDGKAFAPPRQAGGAGGLPARPGQAPRGPGEAKAQATATLAAALLGGQQG